MSLDPKEIRKLIKKISPSPGYITNPQTKRLFTRAEFEDIFDELDIPIMEDEYNQIGDSVAKRLSYFLQVGEPKDIETILKIVTKQS